MATALALPKDDLLTQIWSVLTTLTPEAIAAASAKAAELAYDPNRGIVPLPESMINLASVRDTLEAAIKERKLIQLPITVQTEILAGLNAVGKHLQGLIAGSDEVVNLANSIEALNAAIWKYGLHNLSDQVLGYQTKINQLKNQELQVGKLISELESAQKTAQKISAAVAKVVQKRSEAVDAAESAKISSNGALEIFEGTRETSNKINALFATIQQQESQSGQITANIKAANNELTALDSSIRKFYDEIEDYRAKILQTTEEATEFISASERKISKLDENLTEKVDKQLDAAKEAVENLTSSSEEKITAFKEGAEETVATLEKNLAARSEETIEENRSKTAQLIEELNGLKGQIKAQIAQATGYGLFGAFQSRQNQVAKTKGRWAIAIMALVGISAALTIYIAYEAQTYTAHSLAFYVKLSLSIPLGFAIGFCTVQYNRERRLEEEYAFKASISVSLNPYKDLVQSIIQEDGKADVSKYTDFVIESVKNVFTSPTDKVFETQQKSKGITAKVFKQTAEVIGAGVKAATGK